LPVPRGPNRKKLLLFGMLNNLEYTTPFYPAIWSCKVNFPELTSGHFTKFCRVLRKTFSSCRCLFGRNGKESGRSGCPPMANNVVPNFFPVIKSQKPLQKRVEECRCHGHVNTPATGNYLATLVGARSKSSGIWDGRCTT